MNLKDKLKYLPNSPGVYLMKDSLGNVIYVGKSKKLKSRVSSYFTNSNSHPPKVVKLVNNIRDIEYIKTDTEFEALILECQLIKEIKPIYNKLMKSVQSYLYIRIKANDKFPVVELTKEKVPLDGNIYFGPYTNKNTVERGLLGIKECCKILCTSKPQKNSLCLNYSLGLCIGMCLNTTPREQYIAILNKVTKLLDGTDKSILAEIEFNMNTASEKFEYEKAAKFRDYLTAINYLIKKAKVAKYTKRNKNIAIIEYLNDHEIKCFLIKGNNILFSEKYELEHLSIDSLKNTLKINILHYFNNSSINNPINIGIDEIDESQIIYTYLKNKSNTCKHIIIAAKWLREINSMKIDDAINKLF